MTDARTTVGAVAESWIDERRVVLVPKAVASLGNCGVAVVVESAAGEAALLPDELYSEARASIGDAWSADIVVKVAPAGSSMNFTATRRREVGGRHTAVPHRVSL
jgi:NAD(P) transhydrogenase subunit alpha